MANFWGRKVTARCIDSIFRGGLELGWWCWCWKSWLELKSRGGEVAEAIGVLVLS